MAFKFGKASLFPFVSGYDKQEIKTQIWCKLLSKSGKDLYMMQIEDARSKIFGVKGQDEEEIESIKEQMENDMEKKFEWLNAVQMLTACSVIDKIENVSITEEDALMLQIDYVTKEGQDNALCTLTKKEHIKTFMEENLSEEVLDEFTEWIHTNSLISLSETDRKN